MLKPLDSVVSSEAADDLAVDIPVPMAVADVRPSPTVDSMHVVAEEGQSSSLAPSHFLAPAPISANLHTPVGG